MGSFARLMQAFVQVVGDPENELGADPLKQQLSAALSDGYAFAKAKMRYFAEAGFTSTSAAHLEWEGVHANVLLLGLLLVLLVANAVAWRLNASNLAQWQRLKLE